MATINEIRDIVETAEKFKNSYFWAPPSHASARRSYERYHSRPEITWTEGGHTYTAAYTVRCSCKNIYASGTYTKDGQRTTLTSIRNSLKRLSPT